MLHKRVLITFWLAFASVAAVAQELPGEPTALDERSIFLKLRPSYQPCLDDASGMPAMIRCNQGEYTYQDKRLNATYKKLALTLDQTKRDALVKEERAWIALKEKDCAIPDDAGQGAMLDAVTCSVTYTARRAAVLEGRLKK